MCIYCLFICAFSCSYLMNFLIMYCKFGKLASHDQFSDDLSIGDNSIAVH